MSFQPSIRILIVEDHELARDGMRACLEKMQGLPVVSEASDGREALRIVQETPLDVAIMDIRMPIMDGIEATLKLKADYPHIKVVMLTSYQDSEEVYASLAAGADAYCLKDIRTERLAEVVRMVFDGAVWLDPAIARMVMSALPLTLTSKSRTAAPNRIRYNAELTEREKEVLEKLVDGKSNREIAQELHITLHTVKAHVCNILQKLAVNDRTLAAVKAVRDRLI